MQQTQLKWIAQWYQQASDYVMAFSGQWELLWQNRPCPMLQNITDFGSFFPFSPNDKTSSRTSTICHIGELYRVHCDRNLTDGTPLFLVRIDALPYTDLSMENQEWCNDMENRLAAMRSQIFGISNAVAALYCAIEEQSDACPRTLLEEQMQQLNIIKGNCCRLIRPTVLLAEQMRYCQKKDISGSPFFLDREMSNFVESCRKILGRTLRIQGESESQLAISVNPQRLLLCLLCLILQIKRQYSDTTLIRIAAKKADSYAELTFSAESSGIDETRSRHSPAVLLYHTHLLSQEEVIIRHFCRCYQATLLSAEREQKKMAVLRIPLCDETAPLFLQSGVRRFRSDEDSLYEIMLADISEYRFY